MHLSQLSLLVLLQELLETEAMAAGTAVHQALEAEVSEASKLGQGRGFAKCSLICCLSRATALLPSCSKADMLPPHFVAPS